VQTVTKPEALVFNVIPVPRCRVLQLRSFRAGNTFFSRLHNCALERLRHERLDDEQVRFLEGA
jgi:hypothetical protein